MSLKSFRYKAIDATGKTVRGTVQAVTERDAFKKIGAGGLTPLSFTVSDARKASFSFQKPNITDIAGLTRELSALIEAKVPLHRGLLSIAESEPKQELADILRELASKLESGSPLTVALSSHRAIFGEVYIETLRAAEASGNLSGVMAHLADLLERQLAANQQIKRAMMYPIIVISVVALAVSVIVVFVVPKFAEAFSGQGTKLPLITQAIQTVGVSVKNYWWAYLAAITAIVSTIVVSWGKPRGRAFFERFFLRVPYVRSILIASTAARFAQVFGIGLSSGLDMIESLEIGSRATGRPVFVAECRAMAERLRGGDNLGDVLQSSTYLPNFAKRMISAGKDATELSRACTIVARHFDREAEHLTKNVNTVIEPLLTVVLAVVVLTVALSVFLPMWAMMKTHH